MKANVLKKTIYALMACYLVVAVPVAPVANDTGCETVSSFGITGDKSENF